VTKNWIPAPRGWQQLIAGENAAAVAIGTGSPVPSEEQPSPQHRARRRGQLPKRQPWLDTIGKLSALREHRDDAIERTGKAPAWLASCQAVGIDPHTARTHDPELRKHWGDVTYRKL